MPSPEAHHDAPLSSKGRVVYYAILAVIIAGGIVGIVLSAVHR